MAALGIRSSGTPSVSGESSGTPSSRKSTLLPVLYEKPDDPRTLTWLPATCTPGIVLSASPMPNGATAANSARLRTAMLVGASNARCARRAAVTTTSPASNTTGESRIISGSIPTLTVTESAKSS